MHLSDDLGYISFKSSVYLRFFTEKIPCRRVGPHSAAPPPPTRRLTSPRALGRERFATVAGRWWGCFDGWDGAAAGDLRLFLPCLS